MAVKININRLKNYLSDLAPDTSIVDEAIATIEAVAENKTDDELYERERPLMIAYLALRIVKAGLNVSPQNKEVHAHWTHLGGGLAKCSNCKWIFKDVYDQDNEDTFCRKCGAKMDEEESGNV